MRKLTAAKLCGGSNLFVTIMLILALQRFLCGFQEKRAGARGAPARGVLGFEGKALRDLGRAVCHCAVMLIGKSHKSITTL